MRAASIALIVVTAGAILVAGQGAARVEPATVNCPSVLGQGVRTGLTFCDVPIARDPAAGVLIPLPRRRGDLVLRFDLHNRHLYSEDEIRAGRAFYAYTARIGVMAPDNTLIARAIVQSEFRGASDLFDRVLGGSGPGGLKAVAPTGVEPVAITIGGDFRNEESVSLMGEYLWVATQDGRREQFVALGRPIAVVSGVTLEYTPR